MLYFGTVVFGTVKLEHDTEKRIAIISRVNSIHSTAGMSQEQIGLLIEAELNCVQNKDTEQDTYVDTEVFDGIVVVGDI